MKSCIKYEYIHGALDVDQVCRCCGRGMTLNIDEEKMWCSNPACSAHMIRFTIPYAKREIVVKHRENR